MMLLEAVDSGKKRKGSHFKSDLLFLLGDMSFAIRNMSSLKEHLYDKTFLFGLKLWVVIGIIVGVSILGVLSILVICLNARSQRRSRRASNNLPVSQIPPVSKEIKEVRVEQVSANEFVARDGILLTVHDKSNEKETDKVMVHLGLGKSRHADENSHSGSFHYIDKDGSCHSGDEGSSGTVAVHRQSSYRITAPSPLTGLPEFSYLGWGHWFTLRDLEIATNRFSKDNVLGEGGYGVVYRGQLINGTPVAVKKLLNNLLKFTSWVFDDRGQAEKEFRVEVEAIGHVRHKNLVRLLGYCVEGTQRMLVYEYVNNGNLEQWLHGAMRQRGSLTWEARIKILLGTAKALAYLHEAIEPKVVHRDIKSSNILIDDEFNAKISDFGLAKLLGAGKSHITTRVMGTFGYVAPEYANTGLLNEKSDVYSFGVVLLEAITGRDPVDYGRPANEVNLVDWLKMMVGSRRSEEVVDPSIETRPSTRALKRALLTALRCVDPDSEKRPKMGQVVRMLDSDEPIPREDRRHRRNRAGSIDMDSQRESSDTDKSDNADSKYSSRRNRPSSTK
ncbi:STYKc [Musa troglodytarum]|uniref:non-specific serine/threonine protein kinase n=1 Tax=Musa troglodytarum TaxID=320322 RepID=A0A9E7GUT9_9LILI|nr:STYKc [Musa troglodytarum]